jgi:hypothetical protein
MADHKGPNAFVRGVDTAWVKLGEVLRLPSAVSHTPASAPAEPAPIVELPGGVTKKADFKLVQLTGNYDFDARTSVYKAALVVGKALVRPSWFASCCEQARQRSPDWIVTCTTLHQVIKFTPQSPRFGLVSAWLHFCLHACSQQL